MTPYTIIVFSLLTTLISGNPIFNITERQNLYIYATFYDDSECTVNPGIPVSTSNPGCLANEVGRHSIYFQDGTAGGHNLVFSPDTECGCQNECKPFVDQNAAKAAYCLNLAGNVGAGSFRFIDGDCASNNC